MKLCFTLLLLALSVTRTNAQFLGDVIKAAGNVVNTGVKVVTAPAETIINTGRVVTGSAPPSQIYKPYQDLASSAGRSVSNVNQVASDPQRFLFNRAQSFVSNVGGKPGEFIFDIGTFTNQYYTELANSGIQNAAAILQGSNPLQVAAAPLAAAIRAARERHIQGARAIPDDVKQGLKGFISESVLNRAKYTVGTIQITLPNFIGQGQRFQGNGYAVVVDDIIVFNAPPPSFNEGVFWWTHEVTHVQQYQQRGVEGFAYAYLVDLGRSIEGEADGNGANRSRSTSQVGRAYLNVGSFDRTGYRANVDYRQQPETYIAQCIFPGDPYPVNYLLTNYGRIIAVEPMSGRWAHIGHATPPLMSGVMWTYQTPNLRYAVMPDGSILTTVPVYNPFGQVIGSNFVQIGQVYRL